MRRKLLTVGRVQAGYYRPDSPGPGCRKHEQFRSVGHRPCRPTTCRAGGARLLSICYWAMLESGPCEARTRALARRRLSELPGIEQRRAGWASRRATARNHAQNSLSTVRPVKSSELWLGASDPAAGPSGWGFNARDVFAEQRDPAFGGAGSRPQYCVARAWCLTGAVEGRDDRPAVSPFGKCRYSHC